MFTKMFCFVSMLTTSCALQVAEADVEEEVSNTKYSMPNATVTQSSKCVSEISLTNDLGEKYIVYLKCAVSDAKSPKSDTWRANQTVNNVDFSNQPETDGR